MRSFILLFAIISSCIGPQLCYAQQTSMHLLAQADTLVHNKQFDEVESIADSVLSTDLGDSDRARALLLKARILEVHNHLDSAAAIALDAISIAEKLQLKEVAAGAHTTLGLIYERVGRWQESSDHLDQAEELIFANEIEWLYAQYYIRRASLIRVSIAVNFEDSLALVQPLVEEALKYSTKYNQLWHLADSHLLLLRNGDADVTVEEKREHQKAAVRIYELMGDSTSAGLTRLNISRLYLQQKNYDMAWLYCDSAATAHTLNITYAYRVYALRALLFLRTGQEDSAVVTFQRWQYAFEDAYDDQNRIQIADLTAVHENEKNQVRLDTQIRENREQEKVLNRTIAWLVGVLLIVVLLFFSYRRQRSQTKKIAEQRTDLEQSLDKQKVLLAEVQHRVKNNLQVILAMLDLQREAPEGKTINEITTESQKRIESMALLHDKVYVADDLEKIKLQSYLTELTDLFQETHAVQGLDLKIEVNSEIKSIPVQKAIPLGLITVELMMNSFKHAFNGRPTGAITISTRNLVNTELTSELIYTDDGEGYTGTLQEGGLGLEIIQGLAGQLHGKVAMDGRDGFTAKIQF